MKNGKLKLVQAMCDAYTDPTFSWREWRYLGLGPACFGGNKRVDTGWRSRGQHAGNSFFFVVSRFLGFFSKVAEILLATLEASVRRPGAGACVGG